MRAVRAEAIYVSKEKNAEHEMFIIEWRSPVLLAGLPVNLTICIQPQTRLHREITHTHTQWAKDLSAGRRTHTNP